MTSAFKPNPEYLRLTDLHAFYGESHILHGLDLSVAKGECITLLGRNGSGRTTTLKSIMGLVGRRTGSIMVNGNEVIHVPTHKIAHHGVGYCPEGLEEVCNFIAPAKGDSMHFSGSHRCEYMRKCYADPTVR